ncbi:electron transfer flavoprotein-ubiquinone oxidoreductase [Novosphingobium rosa]|uniref:electron transfer flavoprotein-ubiquinone oxidoreductase n=1 Tax=Novosphingobium rosa TaxID=76978 RepID=UPI00082E639F|nr:electron transfer flavoprotein-ubiquinone oxidoreductase [Novosphingobium rosa]
MPGREAMEYDVVIVGGGPAGLSAAIRLKQQDAGIRVCVLEKGSEIGAHILSGAVVDPRALDELIPDWRERDCPLAAVPVTDNRHWFLTKNGKFSVPHWLTPGWMHNKGTYTGSLGNLCRWLAAQAEELGVEIFPGFAAAEMLYDEHGAVRGVATGDMGVGRDGQPKDDYQPGMELHARYTLFAEGARGHLTKQVIAHHALDAASQPQVYGLGLKELWDIAPHKHQPGLVIHTQGWPLSDAYGGGFLYHQADGQVALGFVVGLGYRNPHLSPFGEFQRWKQHPEIRRCLEGGKRISYGARVINEGGWQSVPKLTFPGGALVGCAAGFVNVPRIKGSHTAMKSGMLAAEAAAAALSAGRGGDALDGYEAALRSSWVAKELRMVRNVQPLIARFGAILGTALAGVEMWMRTLGMGLPYTLAHHSDRGLSRKDAARPITYPAPDGVISFDRLSSVFVSNTNHEEDQPVHLHLADPALPIDRNLPLYGEPARLYCPAGVYEVTGQEEGDPRFVINPQNCLHCKTCDIKDPAANITWVTPEGGGGPNYPNM